VIVGRCENAVKVTFRTLEMEAQEMGLVVNYDKNMENGKPKEAKYIRRHNRYIGKLINLKPWDHSLLIITTLYRK
jgi:hypothetical protein